MEEPSCGTCRYFVSNNNSTPRGQAGKCHAHPPTVSKERWPTTHENEWCDEWEDGSSLTADDIMPV